MKHLVCLILLVSVLRLEAALTVTNRGPGSNSTSQTTLVITPTSTLAAGTLGCIMAAFDNQGAGGSTKIFTQASFVDPVGNTWTRQLDAIYDPVGAGAGVEIAAYTSPITTNVTTSDSITLTVSTATAGKTATLWEISGSGVPNFVTAVAISDLLTSGQTGTAVSQTTSSIPSGDAIIAWTGMEGNAAMAALDTDTTNGTWSGPFGPQVGTPMRLSSQSKVVTGTGTQTYDVTLGASYDWICAWMQFSETAVVNSATNGFLIWY